MDPETKQMLQETLALAEENNKMLHKIRGVQRREAIWSTIKILVIIAIALGSFYYLEPYLEKVMNLYNSISGIQQDVKSAADSVKNITDTPNSILQDLLKKI